MAPGGFEILTTLIIIIHASGSLGRGHTRPHIIFFFVDDMGWNDVGFHGMTQIPTPNIDALAANGIILNHYYTNPVCSPSRASLLTGLYSSTNGMQHYELQDMQRSGLPLNNKTLPEYLRHLGYKNHIVGKWNLGFHQEQYLPESRGFDSHYGFWNAESDHFFHTSYQTVDVNLTYNVPLYETSNESISIGGLNFRRGKEMVLDRQGEYLADIYTNESIKIINYHSIKCEDKPLFLYLAHHGVHRGNLYGPVNAPRKYTDPFKETILDNKRNNFAGALTAIDISLGQVMSALEVNGMLDNTLFVFSTDNGSPPTGSYTDNGGSNYPLRGGKVTGWDGGVRGNAFVWSPMFKNRSLVYDGLMHISDWLPTLYSAAGGKVSDLNGPLDGKDMFESLNNLSPSPRDEILHLADNIWNMTSYRKGDYKIIKGVEPGVPSLDGYFGDTGRESPPAGLSTTESETARVLRKFYKTKDIPTRPKILDIDCGDIQVNECNVAEEFCLFNLRDDPCERRNLAAEKPQLLQQLITQMEQIPKINALNLGFDYASNPVYYAGFWSPWSDIHYNIHAGESD